MWSWLISQFKASLLSLDSFLTGMPHNYNRLTFFTAGLSREGTRMRVNENAMVVQIPEAGEEWEHHPDGWRNTATDRVTPAEEFEGYLDHFQGEIIQLSPTQRRLD